jgi:hypothetical protein
MCNRAWSLETEPDVHCFADYNCGGYAWKIPVGDYPFGWPPGPFGNDMISSCIVPPNKLAYMYIHPGYQALHAFAPGFYPATPANDAYSSAKIKRVLDWNDTVTACCAKNKPKAHCPGLPYGPNAGGCNPFMMKYCAKNPDNANSDVCQEWYLKNPTFKAQIAEMVCANPANIEHEKCKDWCRQNPGKCDIAADEFCKKHPKDPFCLCKTSPVTKYNPACVDSQCISNGYVTASMKSKKCPDIVDCRTQIELETAGRTTTGNISSVQNCGNEGGAPPAPVSNTNNIMIFLFILIIVILIAGFVTIYRKKDIIVHSKP